MAEGAGRQAAAPADRAHAASANRRRVAPARVGAGRGLARAGALEAMPSWRSFAQRMLLESFEPERLCGESRQRPPVSRALLGARDRQDQPRGGARVGSRRPISRRIIRILGPRLARGGGALGIKPRLGHDALCDDERCGRCCSTIAPECPAARRGDRRRGADAVGAIRRWSTSSRARRTREPRGLGGELLMGGDRRGRRQAGAGGVDRRGAGCFRLAESPHKAAREKSRSRLIRRLYDRVGGRGAARLADGQPRGAMSGCSRSGCSGIAHRPKPWPGGSCAAASGGRGRLGTRAVCRS